MNDDCLKLTTYFGEWDRTEHGLLAAELMRLCDEQQVAASIMLRAAEGFGRLHHLRTDSSLTTSDHLPLVSVAVDRREVIEATLELLLQDRRRGLITLERARLLDGEITDVSVPAQPGDATKLTIYLGHEERVSSTPAFMAICELLHRRGLDGATVLLGFDGTRGGERFQPRFRGRYEDAPMMVIAVGSGEKIAQVLPEVGALLRRPLMTLERLLVCKRDGQLISAPPQLSGTDEHGLAIWQKLMIYTSESASHHGHPVHQQIVRRLQRESDTAGATVLVGFWGFHGEQPPHGERVWQIRSHLPVCTIVIDRPERIAQAFKIVDEITAEHGLVTCETVPAAQSTSGSQTRGGLRLARRRH